MAVCCACCDTYCAHAEAYKSESIILQMNTISLEAIRRCVGSDRLMMIMMTNLIIG